MIDWKEKYQQQMSQNAKLRESYMRHLAELKKELRQYKKFIQQTINGKK